ncbi:hypothetical protein OIU76_002514 [Salix suchowensis]|nr:hypothetical protein OIU76_002514 [Salix suchowensis]
MRKIGLVDKLFHDEVKEGESEKLVRRRQKSEADFTSIYTDLLIREESSGPAFSTITGKGLALRPKSRKSDHDRCQYRWSDLCTNGSRRSGRWTSRSTEVIKRHQSELSRQH